MPRYEYVDDSSSKFWEIERDGCSFTTTYGRIGSAGQSSTKSFPDERAAEAAYDKLVAEKVKKGYVLAGTAPAAVEEKPEDPAATHVVQEKKVAKRSGVKTVAARPATEVLAHARELLTALRQANGDDRSAIRALVTKAKEISADEAVDALEAWLTQHAGALRVRRGTVTDAVAQLEKRYGKLPALYNLLLTRFGGFLEVSVAREYWANIVHRDGLRVLGISSEYPECDVAAQMPRYLEFVAAAERDDETKKQAMRWKTMIPVLSNLYDISDAWVAGGTKIEWFRWRTILDSPGWQDWVRGSLNDEPMHPRFGPSFSLLVRLLYIEERLAKFAELKKIEHIVSSVEPVAFDARHVLAPKSDPGIAIEMASGMLVVTADLGPSLEYEGELTPLVRRRIVNANENGRCVKYSHDTDDDWLGVQAEVPLSGLTSADVKCALARIRAARYAFQSATPFAFDDEARPMPEDVAGLLREAGADAETFDRAVHAVDVNELVYGSQTGSYRDHGTDIEALLKELDEGVRTVTCIGREHPRIRWSFSIPLADAYFGGYLDSPRRRPWFPTRRGDRCFMVVELLCEGITRERVDILMESLLPMPLSATKEAPSNASFWWIDALFPKDDEKKQVQRAGRKVWKWFLSNAAADAVIASPDFWRTVAATYPLTEARLREVVASHRSWLKEHARHRSWLKEHARQKHAWRPYTALHLETVIYQGGGSSLEQADLSLSDLRGASLAEQDLTASKMVHTLANEVDFSRARLEHIWATASDFGGARFDGAVLKGADFSRSNLRGASFRGADCTGVDFERCDLTGCDFTGARLDGILTKNTIQPPLPSDA